ncbi:hypothetical protein NEI03_00210 [Brachyspira pilosicoli]|uniref:hypothetical protein n=1 Tax=Brachyspira pilosicoli TaxID=52584 RepID=UPI0025427776|nr:hypothetical protein [Brachyspira pilosicoli]WIH85853.1 hypothetical protein NEI03_00210 [Brachyspira pilosicoli]
MAFFNNILQFYNNLKYEDKERPNRLVVYFAYFLYLNNQKEFSAKDLNNCLEECDLPSTNINQILQRETKKRNLIKKRKGFYSLHRNKIDEFDNLFNNVKLIPTNAFFDLNILENLPKDRYYINQISEEMCLCYDNQCYTACLIMMRKLLEAIIIDIFESIGELYKIKDSNGVTFFLSDLINIYMEEKSINKSRNIKKELDKLKEIGDKAVHKYNFRVSRKIADEYKITLDVVIQELISNIKIK